MTTDGIPPASLGDSDLLRELASVHNSRTATLRHGSEQALAEHTHRMGLLEAEYLRRWPEREVDPARRRPEQQVDVRPTTVAKRSLANKSRRRSAGSAVAAAAQPLAQDVIDLVALRAPEAQDPYPAS